MTPSRASKDALARSRSRAIFVTSTSITVVNCADTARDSTIRAAITLRSRDIVTVVPRSGEVATGADVRDADGADGAADATGVTAVCLAAASTSSRRIRPPIPVAFTVARFTPSSDASFRTIGVT